MENSLYYCEHVYIKNTHQKSQHQRQHLKTLDVYLTHSSHLG